MNVHTSRAPEPNERNETDGSAGSSLALAGAGLVGAAVAVSLGVYGRTHTPTGLTIDPLNRDQLLVFKATLTSVGAGLAMFQLFSALWMFGKLDPLPKPSWLGTAHRWSGVTAFLCTIPVAYHCLWALGFQDYSTRVLLHSLLGCAFYGAFSTKLLVLHSKRMPGWALPVAGGTLVTLLTGLWLTAAFWYFTDIDLFAAFDG